MVAEGRAESISAWGNDALRLKADYDPDCKPSMISGVPVFPE